MRDNQKIPFVAGVLIVAVLFFLGACSTSKKGTQSDPSFGEQTVDDQNYVQGFPIIRPLILPAATGGDGTLAYSLAPLPEGLAFNISTRELSGLPTTLGLTAVTYTVQDANGNTDSIMFSIRIRLPEPRNICSRTQVVQDAILDKIHETDPSITCSTVNEAHLLRISGTLSIRNTGVTALQEGDLNGLHFLRHLILERNVFLTSIPENLFAELFSLEHLSLDNNDLTNFPSLAGLTELTSFQAHGNAFTSIPENAFADNDKLREITLNSNRLTSIPENLFEGLSNLQELNMGNNRLTSLPEDLFDGLSSLQELRLDILRNVVLPEDLFDGLSNLETLTMLNNRMTSLPTGLLDGLNRLSCMDLRGNFLDSMPGICSSGVTCDDQCSDGRAVNPPADTVPSFSTRRIDDQDYVNGITITPLNLPAPTGGNAPLEYSLTGQPSGLSLSGRQLTGTPTEEVTNRAVTFTVTDRDGDTASLTFRITVTANTAPEFDSGTIGDQSYIEGIAITTLTFPQASGGNGALTYSIDPESPFGLTFDATTRMLSGSPTAVGTSTVTYKVVDRDGDTQAADEDTITFTITVAANAAPDFGSGTITGQSYIEGIAITTLTLPQAATGGNGVSSYSIDPPSPFGLTFDPSTRMLSGTPSGTGTEMVTYKVQDADGDMRATDEDTLMFTIEVAADTEPSFDGQMIGSLQYVPNSAITPVPLPAASSGNGPLTYSLPSRPDGFDFNAETRVLSGTPTTLGSTSMTYSVRDVDGDETTLTFTIEIIADAMPSFAGQTIDTQQYVQAVAITPEFLPEATGGNGNLAYSLAPLPDGITFNIITRELSGSPTTVGSTDLTYTARDEDGDEETLTFTINVATDTEPSFGTQTIDNQNYINGIAITPLDLPEATGGNMPLEYSLTGQPAGLSLSERQLIGTPTEEVADRTVTFTATDVDGDEIPLTFMITVVANNPPDFGSETIGDQNYIDGITITPLELPEATVGSGNGDLTYSINPAAPFGLTFDTATRRLSGIPTGTETRTVTYTVQDADGDTQVTDTATLTFTIRVVSNTAPAFASGRIIENQTYIEDTAITPLELPEATVGSGNGDVTYSINPAAPFGLTFDPSTRTLSGTPTGSGDETVTYTVQDGDGDMTDGDTAMLTFTIRVIENIAPDFGSETIGDQNYIDGIAITPLELPEATGGNEDLTYSINPVSPLGLRFDPSTRRLSGSPTTVGTTTVTYTVQDGDGDMRATDEDTLMFDIAVIANDAPDFASETIADKNYIQRTTITPEILPQATGGNGSLTYSLAPTGNPGGMLPAGLTFNPATRELSGTPTTPGRTPMTYTARDADGDTQATDEAMLTFNIVIMSPIKNICDRTQQVQDAILAKINGADPVPNPLITCSTVTEQHLAGIGELSLSDEGITSLKSDDFDGLSRLTELDLKENDLTVLPSDVFDGLSSLSTLRLNKNDLTVLPSDVFAGLSNLLELNLSNNALTNLPADVFDGLSNLRTLHLYSNDLTDLPEDVFSGLSSLTDLAMWSNDLTDLPADLFDGLSNLAHLWLNDNNDLTDLPADLFDGLSSLADLDLRETSLDSIPAICSQSGVTCQFSVADTNPSFGENTVPGQSYTRGTTITPLQLPGASSGNGTLMYSLAPTGDPGGMPPAGLSFNSDTRVLSGTPTALLPSTDFTYTVQDEDGDTDTIRFSIEVAGQSKNICSLTQQVEDAILARIHEIDNTITCDSVPEVHLPLVTALDLSNSGISSLQADDFDGLSGLEDLNLRGNSLTALPADVFDGLSNLDDLDLRDNDLTALPADVFDGLANLADLDLQLNDLTALPAGVFDGLSSLEKLYLRDNDLTTLPADVFDMLSSLRTLDLHDNDLTNNDVMTALPVDAFDMLSSLWELNLSNNSLSNLPAGVFNGLSELRTLHLNNNSLSTLPVNVFNGLSKLTDLGLWSNGMMTLPAGAFNGLSKLRVLHLNSNSLSTLLPSDVFDGLSDLRTLRLNRNRITTLPADLFDGLSDLRVIDLEGNSITSFPDGLFSGLSNLSCLDLRRNNADSTPDICSSEDVTCDARCRIIR